jgi:hypothetical protein
MTASMSAIYSSMGLHPGMSTASSHAGSLQQLLSHSHSQSGTDQQRQGEQDDASSKQQQQCSVLELQQELPDLDLNIDVVREIRLHDDGFLGAGAFGCVYKGTYKGREVAVKLLSKMFDGEKPSSTSHMLQR